MSARELARRLALLRKNDQLGDLAEVLTDGTPADLRAYLLAFYELRDVTATEREHLTASGAPLSCRMVAACIAREVDEAIALARSMLTRIARGRGRPASPGCRGGTPAVKGHGCPAFAGSPVGVPVSGWTRADDASALDITTHANPLFAAQMMQELPGGICRDNLNLEGEKMQ